MEGPLRYSWVSTSKPQKLYHSIEKIHQSHLLIPSVKLPVPISMQPTQLVRNVPLKKKDFLRTTIGQGQYQIVY